MKKKVLIILVFVIAVISLFTFKVVLNSRENDKTKIVDKKEKDKNENIINDIETNNLEIPLCIISLVVMKRDISKERQSH